MPPIKIAGDKGLIVFCVIDVLNSHRVIVRAFEIYNPPKKSRIMPAIIY